MSEHIETTAGNMAAMRKALERITEWFDEGGWSEEAEEEMDAMLESACAALSAPARNCDLDEVAENPEAAWLNDEDNWDEWGSPKLCIEKWLLAPAKKGGEDGVEGKHVQKKG